MMRVFDVIDNLSVFSNDQEEKTDQEVKTENVLTERRYLWKIMCMQLPSLKSVQNLACFPPSKKYKNLWSVQNFIHFPSLENDVKNLVHH
jgi:hypothetical protein